MKKKIWTKLISLLLLMILMLAVVPQDAYAASAVISYGSRVTVPSDGSYIIADKITFNGVTVNSYYKKYGTYSKSDKTYCCAAYVTRFYKKVFGVTVSNLSSTSSVPKCSKGKFTATKTPVVGDIVRWNKSVHWSIVKEVKGDTITLIQQNYWSSDHKAALKNVKINKNSTSFTFYHWDGYQNYDLSKGSIQLSAVSYTYNGLPHRPTVTVKSLGSDKALVLNQDYTISYASDSINAGTKTITVTGKGKYTGKLSKTYKIQPRSISSTTTSIAAQYYTGKVKTPTFTLKDSSITLTKGTNYTVTYSNNINIGIATVTVKGTGNYTGTKTFNFVINPAKMAAPTLSTTASIQRTTINVKWSASGGSVTGYQIAYKKNSDSSWKTVTVTGGTKTSYSITSGLSRLTKYNVRIRAYKTVNGKNYFSPWSDTKNITTPVLK